MYYALFARAGFTDAARALAAEQGAMLVDLEELGQELEGGVRAKSDFTPPTACALN